MNVTIIGAGNMGRGIGTRLVSGGHSVTFVDADPESARKSAQAVRAAAASGASVATASLETVELGEVVVLALWYGVNTQVVEQLGERLAGKVLVDIANPVNSSYDALVTRPDSSSAEEVAKVAGSEVKVVKAFNTTYASTLLAGQAGSQPLDVFIAGDDTAAKNQVARLIKDGGMRPIDTGPLSRARQIEGLQLLHIGMQPTLGTNYGSSIKILG